MITTIKNSHQPPDPPIVTNDYFFKLNIKSTVVDNIKNKIGQAHETDWRCDQDIPKLKLTVDDFQTDSNIVKFIEHFKTHNRLSVFRSEPNTSYQWHHDSTREAALNLLIDGFDSFCLFGQPAPKNFYINLAKLQHKPCTYYLMNTTKFHSVYVFNQKRYLVSIGVLAEYFKFSEVYDYCKTNALLAE